MYKTAQQYLGADKPAKYRLMDYYNRHCYPYVASNRKYRIQYNDNWCAMFATVIANKCGLTAEQFPYEVSVFYQVQWAKKNNRFYTDPSKIKANDLIIYDWQGDGVLDHVGIIGRVADGKVYVIEGNIKDTVGYRTLPLSSKSIVGYIDIDYPVRYADPAKERERIADLARQVMAGKYGNGAQRKTLLGTDYDAVQKYINTMY